MQHQKQKLLAVIQQSYVESEKLVSHKDKDSSGIIKKLPIDLNLINQSDIDYLKECGMKISSYQKNSENSRLITSHKNQIDHLIIDNFSKLIAIEKINFDQRLEDKLTQPLHSKSVVEKFPKFFNFMKLSVSSLALVGIGTIGIASTFPAIIDYTLANHGAQTLIAATGAAAFTVSAYALFNDPSTKKTEVMNTLADKFSRTTYIDNDQPQARLENLEKDSLQDKIGSLRAKTSPATLAPGLSASKF